MPCSRSIDCVRGDDKRFRSLHRREHRTPALADARHAMDHDAIVERPAVCALARRLVAGAPCRSGGLRSRSLRRRSMAGRGAVLDDERGPPGDALVALGVRLPGTQCSDLCSSGGSAWCLLLQPRCRPPARCGGSAYLSQSALFHRGDERRASRRPPELSEYASNARARGVQGHL